MQGRRTETMDRDARMYMLYQQNVSMDRIAQQEGVTEATVRTGIRRAIQDQFRLSADESRMLAEDQIDGMMRMTRTILFEDAFLIGVNGKVAINPKTGEPLRDHTHIRQTIALLSKLLDQKIKLLGLNQPIRHRVEVTDKLDSEIERMLTELAAAGAVPGKVLAELPAAEGGESDGGGDSGAGA